MSNTSQQQGGSEKMYTMPQRALAEMLGTAALVLVGPGSVIATLTLAGKATPAVTEADLLAISFAFGLIITALVYAIGKVSGCHINPAVTFALAATKRFPWRELPVYWVAQVVGAVIGGFAIWGAFGPELVQAIAGGTTFWTQYVPVYLVPGLVGAAGAAFIYDFLANPRLVGRPIKEAVTVEDRAAADDRSKAAVS